MHSLAGPAFQHGLAPLALALQTHRGSCWSIVTSQAGLHQGSGADSCAGLCREEKQRAKVQKQRERVRRQRGEAALKSNEVMTDRQSFAPSEVGVCDIVLL